MIAVFDTADLVGPGAAAADILVVAGYCLPRERVPDLMLQVRAAKQRICGHPHVPVKWNLRGQDRAMALHGCVELQPSVLRVADELRSALLECLRAAHASLFVSILHAYSYRRQVLVDMRETLTRFAFANILMRLGLYRRGAADTRATEVVLDWPEGSAPAPFVTEYLHAWRDGVSPNGEHAVQYRCGPLRNLGFSPGPVFGVTDVDERLQLADLCVATSRAFVNFAMGRASADEYAVQQFRRLVPHLYSTAHMVMGRGITVAPVNGELSHQVLDAVQRLA